MKKVLLILSALFALLATANAQVSGDYRTTATLAGGCTNTWGQACNWETYNGSAWVTTATAPTSVGTATVTITRSIGINTATAPTVNNLLVTNNAVLTIGAAANTARNIIANGDVTIDAGSKIDMPQGILADITTFKTFKLTIGGNLTNNGEIDFVGQTSIGEISFTKNGTVSLTGSGVYTLGNLRLQPASGTTALSVSSGTTINLLSTPAVQALLVLETGGSLTIGGGTINVDGRINIKTGSSLIINSGTLEVPTGGTVNTGSNSIFEVGTSATFDMSGGNINIKSKNINTTQADVRLQSGNLTGGTITLSDAALTLNTTATIPNLVVNTGANTATLRSNATITNLTLTSGKLKINDGFTLTTTPPIASASSSNYIITGGTGLLAMNVGTSPILFPIGASSTSYDPVSITNTSGTNNFTASVQSSFTATNTLPSDVTKVFSREWNIVSASTSANLAFTPDAASTPTPAPTSVTLGHYVGGVWVESFATVSGGTYSGTFTSFSPFGVGENGAFSGTVLPVELLNFKGKMQGTSNLLTWQTASEKDNSHFDIERSVNGLDFIKIGQVKGYGSKQDISDYNFSDNTPQAVNYYRLRQVDFDGKEQVSKVLNLNNSAKGTVKIYPSVSSTFLTVDLPSDVEYATVLITDMLGRNSVRQNISAGQQVNISSLVSGTYFISIDVKGVKTTQRFIKN